MNPTPDQVKSQRISNGKKKGRNNGKNGNPYLAWAFIEAASHAVRHYPRITAWYERKKRKRNAPVAMKALACKLSKAVWHVMQGKDFLTKRCCLDDRKGLPSPTALGSG